MFSWPSSTAELLELLPTTANVVRYAMAGGFILWILLSLRSKP